MADWIAFPYAAADYTYDAEALRTHWARLHLGDAEPLPAHAGLLAAWSHYHAGRFQQAREAGLALGAAGLAVANRAQCVQANYLEPSEKIRLCLFAQVVERAQAQATVEPGNPAAHYALAYALVRCGRGINVAQAQAQGLDERVRAALETTLALAPRHAQAHAALGAFHAELIDRLGRSPGKAQGADAATALKLFKQALALDPGSALARIEYANGLVMIEGDKRAQEAENLYRQAAECLPRDATERLDVEIARSELEDD